jgi:hypothetical protein
MTREDPALHMSRLAGVLIITVAAATVGGRILGLARVYEPYLYRSSSPDDRRNPWPVQRPSAVPTLGANDRSRWATVRALVENHTYVVGRRTPTGEGTYEDHGIITEPGWETIDKVLDPETGFFYSSKPPLLPTLVAGEYWLLRTLFGWSLTDPAGQVIRIVLLTVNWLPFVVYLVVLGRLLAYLTGHAWTRLYVLAAAAFGTMVTPFLISLNNHTIAACSAVFALWYCKVCTHAVSTQHTGSNDKEHTSADAVSHDGGYATWAGFFAGFTAANELPAGCFAVALFTWLLLTRPRLALLRFLPGAIIPLASLVLTNYLAVARLLPVYSEVGGPWYRYPGSYWSVAPEKGGIDWAAENKALYAFHLLLGHHGLFSLTPVFFLALPSLTAVWAGRLLGQGPPTSHATDTSVDGTGANTGLDFRRAVAAITGLVSLIVVIFYVVQTNNYGGWTAGPRWLLWLTPLLLLNLPQTVDRLAIARQGRIVALALLGVSVASASYSIWSPWRHPWLYDWFEYHGWIRY